MTAGGHPRRRSCHARRRGCRPRDWHGVVSLGRVAGSALRYAGRIDYERRRAGVGAEQDHVSNAQRRRAFGRGPVDKRRAAAGILKHPLAIVNKQRAVLAGDSDGGDLQICLPGPADNQRTLDRPVGQVNQSDRKSVV